MYSCIDKECNSDELPQISLQDNKEDQNNFTMTQSEKCQTNPQIPTQLADEKHLIELENKAFIHEITTKMHESYYSTTNSSDVSVLAARSEEAADSDEKDFDGQHFQIHLSAIDTTDFTMLYKPQRQSLSRCSFDESTEVLLEQSDYNHHGKGSHHCSGTDSDVEVLVSEEVVDSDWSTGAADLDKSIQILDDDEKEEELNDDEEIFVTNTTPMNRQESNTDQDISFDEDCSRSSVGGAIEKSNQTQLMDVICKQATRIRQLEDQVQHYRALHQKLFAHLDTLRLELEADEPTTNE